MGVVAAHPQSGPVDAADTRHRRVPGRSGSAASAAPLRGPPGPPGLAAGAVGHRAGAVDDRGSARRRCAASCSRPRRRRPATAHPLGTSATPRAARGLGSARSGTAASSHAGARRGTSPGRGPVSGFRSCPGCGGFAHRIGPRAGCPRSTDAGRCPSPARRTAPDDCSWGRLPAGQSPGGGGATHRCRPVAVRVAGNGGAGVPAQRGRAGFERAGCGTDRGTGAGASGHRRGPSPLAGSGFGSGGDGKPARAVGGSGRRRWRGWSFCCPAGCRSTGRRSFRHAAAGSGRERRGTCSTAAGGSHPACSARYRPAPRPGCAARPGDGWPGDAGAACRPTDGVTRWSGHRARGSPRAGRSSRPGRGSIPGRAAPAGGTRGSPTAGREYPGSLFAPSSSRERDRFGAAGRRRTCAAPGSPPCRLRPGPSRAGRSAHRRPAAEAGRSRILPTPRGCRTLPAGADRSLPGSGSRRGKRPVRAGALVRPRPRPWPGRSSPRGAGSRTGPHAAAPLRAAGGDEPRARPGSRSRPGGLSTAYDVSGSRRSGTAPRFSGPCSARDLPRGLSSERPCSRRLVATGAELAGGAARGGVGFGHARLPACGPRFLGSRHPGAGARLPLFEHGDAGRPRPRAGPGLPVRGPRFRGSLRPGARAGLAVSEPGDAGRPCLRWACGLPVSEPRRRGGVRRHRATCSGRRRGLPGSAITGAP
jgi:hypothetical protein